MKFYKLRALALLFLVRIISKILFVEMIPIPSVTAMIRRGDKLLFVNLSYFNGYGFPGGIIQSDEDAEAALRREVKEETGLEVGSSRYLFSSCSRFRGVATLSFIFEVEVGGDLRSSREGSVIWLDPKDAIDHLAYPNTRPMFERYLRENFR